MSEATAEPVAAMRFPRLEARDLEGRGRSLPEDFSGTHNLVVVAFRREQQSMVDSWIAWFDTIAAQHPGLRCYEVPVIATRWSLARPVIDGGMAQAVRAQEARRRTLTVYTDIWRVTDALAIDDTRTVTALIVDRRGRVRGRTTGPATELGSARLLAALTDDGGDDAAPGAPPAVEQFSFAFDARFRPILALIGVRPGTAQVTLTPERLVARFGPWTCETSMDNVQGVCQTGPYRWFKAIGPRGSMVDRGLTFGSTATAGVCVLLREPVPGLAPIRSLRHPGLTLTLADPERFVSSLRRHAGL